MTHSLRAPAFDMRNARLFNFCRYFHPSICMSTRRQFITGSAVTATALAAPTGATQRKSQSCNTEVVSQCGEWLFRTDPKNVGEKEQWFRGVTIGAAWHKVVVPHTWQVESGLAEYRGVAWYVRSFDVPERWQNCAVRVEFEAVFHSAQVWVNSVLVGEHERKGYTAFALDITRAIQPGKTNLIAVRVDNAFNEHMLPRGRSSDWAHDGGIYRPVQLLVTPPTFIERVDIDALPDLESAEGKLTIVVHIRNTSADLWKGRLAFRVVEGMNSSAVLSSSPDEIVPVKGRSSAQFTVHATLPKAKLWHFDDPNLYQLEVSISDEMESHRFTTTFGVRKFETRDGFFYLNGERVRLMGVERMAGSNPQFGMAEPTDWIEHDYSDLKQLNCVFTRAHWPQDKHVLDYCDHHGILIQTEVPAWGPDTFAGMSEHPAEDVVQSGLEQLHEMIACDRNHPSIFAWGLCNEINGQNPPAHEFAKRMLEEAKRLDPSRLCSYASNSLAQTPQRDVAGLMDFIETNEYYGTWAPGTADDAAHHLDELHAAFPSKPIVVSEYGYCACTPDRPEDDARRMAILRTHQDAIRMRDFVGGSIFFCYNDYRTHVGDRGLGPLQQRVHGVVDLYGVRKPSYELLRLESSPIESVPIERHGMRFGVRIIARRNFPMYTLRGYRLRGLFFGPGNIPVEQQEVALPDAAPGSEITAELVFGTLEQCVRLEIDVIRPTSFSVHSLEWKP